MRRGPAAAGGGGGGGGRQRFDGGYAAMTHIDNQSDYRHETSNEGQEARGVRAAHSCPCRCGRGQVGPVIGSRALGTKVAAEVELALHPKAGAGTKVCVVSGGAPPWAIKSPVAKTKFERDSRPPKALRSLPLAPSCMSLSTGPEDTLRPRDDAVMAASVPGAEKSATSGAALKG